MTGGEEKIGYMLAQNYMICSACLIIDRIFDKAFSDHSIWYNTVKDLLVQVSVLY